MDSNTSLKTEDIECVRVSPRISSDAVKALAKPCYEHADETYKPGDKISGFVVACGVFAVICLAVSVFFVTQYGIDAVFAVMMAAYVVIAVFCLVGPAHYRFSVFLWSTGFKSRLIVPTPGTRVDFYPEHIEFATKKGKKSLEFDKMQSIYQTDECYVFHYNDANILPITKKEIEKVSNALKCNFFD